MLALELYLLSLTIALCAFTYSVILTDAGMILFNWRGFLFRLFSKGCNSKGEDHWLFKILIGCEYCISGQWALWIYLYISIFGSDLLSTIQYDPFIHIAFVLITVFNMALINKAGIYDKEE